MRRQLLQELLDSVLLTDRVDVRDFVIRETREVQMNLEQNICFYNYEHEVLYSIQMQKKPLQKLRKKAIFKWAPKLKSGTYEEAYIYNYVLE